MVGPSLHPVGNSLVVGSSVQVWTCGVNISARYIGYSWLYNHFVPLLGINWSVNVEFLPRFNVIWSFFPTFLVLVLLFWREVAFLCCCYTAELDVYSCTGQSPVACLCCLLSVWTENANPYCCATEKILLECRCSLVPWWLSAWRSGVGYLGLFELRACITHHMH